MENLITYASMLFQQSEDSPPRINAPLNEPGTSNANGPSPAKSNRSSMPPPPIPTSPRKHHQKSASITSTRPSLEAPRPVPQDFTPDLPPRPTNSIHPSLRAGPHASPARYSPTLRSAQFFDDEVRVTPQAPLLSSQEEPDNRSTTSLPPPLPPRSDARLPSPSLPLPPSSSSTTFESSADAALPQPIEREPSSKRSSRQIVPEPESQEQYGGDGNYVLYSDVFSPSPLPPRSDVDLSSTAAAAAFASASPSPSSSASGHSSPTKKSGHSRKGSD